MRTAPSLCLLLSLYLFALICQKCTSFDRVMVWMCLEFCDETGDAINSNLNEIYANKEVLDAVSFEKYTLGPNSTLVQNNLTAVSSNISAMGLELWPLLSSFPHPPEFIVWMREVFQHPEPFIATCIKESKKYGYTGWNLDWEPTEGVTEADALLYAAFIDTFSNALHKEKLLLTVDVATWSPIWQYDAINKTRMDRAISMGTYTSSNSSFEKQLGLLVDTFGSERSGVGLEDDSSVPIPYDDMVWRFQKIVDSGAAEIDVWAMPLPSQWWSLIKETKGSE